MKRIIFILLMLGSLSLSAQFKPFVSTAKPFSLETGTAFLSYSNEWNDFLLFGREEHTEKVYSLLMTDDNDELVITSNVRVATQVEDNHFSLAGLALAGRNLTAFVESRNFKTGRNVMAMQAVDNKGGLTSEGMLVGYFDFAKAEQPGIWHISSSPDQKSIALIAQLPHVPGEADRFMYFFINENLTITHKGEFLAGEAGQEPIKLGQFLTSNQGELYLVAEGTEKNGRYPLVYKNPLGSARAAALPLSVAEGQDECGEYKAGINPAGELVIAGYVQRKAGSGQVQTTGTWTFGSLSQQIKVSPFDPAGASGTAGQRTGLVNLVFNNDTYFLIGGTQDFIRVSGFRADGSKKFEVPVNHQQKPAGQKQEDGIASGILRNKLCLIYKEGAVISVGVSNDGLLSDRTRHDVLSGLTVFPQFFSANENHMTILSKTETGIKTIAFR